MWETERHLSGFNAVSVGHSEVLWCYKGPGNGRDQKNKRTFTEVLA